jgi:hypothetical protein
MKNNATNFSWLALLFPIGFELVLINLTPHNFGKSRKEIITKQKIPFATNKVSGMTTPGTI